MSDNKKWFKVWATILNDPTHSNMTLEDVGRWTRLGAYLVSVGELGKVIIMPPAKAFLVAMESASIEAVKVALKRLPNVHIEEVNADNGSFIVLMRNWYKYQVDTTHTERQKRARHKRRGEEKRSLTSTSTPTPALRASPPFGGAVATRETSKPGGLEHVGNEEPGSAGIFEQVIKRQREKRSEELRKEPTGSPDKPA